MGLGDDIRRAMSLGADRGLMRAAEQVLERAKADVPVGDPAQDPDPSVSLRESGHIVRHGRHAVEVHFDTPYAAKLELDMHLKHPRGGKAHFLEDALKAELPRLEGIVATEIGANLALTRR